MLISFLYDFIYAQPLYLATLILMSDLLRIPERGITFYVLSFLIMGVLTSLKNVAKSLNILMVGILSVASLGIVLVQKPDQRMVYVQEHLWIGSMMLVGTMIFLLSRLIILNRFIRLGSALILLIISVGIMLNYIPADRMVIALIFLEVLIYLIERIQFGWEKSGDTDHKKHLVFVAPALIIICMIVYLVPASDKPYDWNFVRLAGERAVQIVKTATRYIPGKNEDYSDVGFSENTVLAEIIKPNPKERIELVNVINSPNTVYLAGKYFDTFSGREWSNTYVADNHNRYIDTLETRCAVEQYDSKYSADYLRYSVIDLKYQIFNTRYLFAPPKTNLKDRQLNNIEYADRSDALIAGEDLGYGSEYSIRYYELNKDNSEFGKFIDSRVDFDKDLWEYKSENTVDISYEAYLKYKKDMKEYYSEDIELSENLSRLLDKIYDGSESEWDKMKRLEQWLLTYKYSDEPGELPEKVKNAKSFLDYFVLEKKEGYCVHFATAFVLLARAEGLPARLAQGYLVNTDGQKTVTVMSNMAHAWPEIYYENVGWIPFDPTPGYYKAVSWEISDHSGDGTVESNDERNYEELRDYYRQLAEDEEELYEDENVESPPRKPLNIAAIIIPVVFALLFAMIFYSIYRYLVMKKYRSLDLLDKAKTMCRLNMQILNILGYRVEKGETLEEFGRKLSTVLPGDITEFIEAYEELLYAKAKGSEELLNQINSTNVMLMNELKTKKGVMTLFYKFLLNIKFTTFFIT